MAGPGDRSFFIFNITKKIFESEKSNSVNVIYKCNDDKCSNFLYYTFLDVTITTENKEIIHNASNPIKKTECTPLKSDAANETICKSY